MTLPCSPNTHANIFKHRKLSHSLNEAQFFEMEGSSGLDKLADPAVLEAIDKLFELNIGEYVALPQVCDSDLRSRRMLNVIA